MIQRGLSKSLEFEHQGRCLKVPATQSPCTGFGSSKNMNILDQQLYRRGLGNCMEKREAEQARHIDRLLGSTAC
jgi:hypothetical protein